MQVSVEKTSELIRKMTVRLPESTVQEKMESRLKSIARDVKVHGFRPGKVPASVVKKMYGSQVRGEIFGDLIENSYFNALKQENLIPAGQPRIETTETENDFEYIAEFEVYPEVSLNGINELEIIRPESSVTEADVDEMIAKLREQKKTWQAVERASEQGDKVTIHFSGESEGKNFTNGKAENYPIEIGAKQMVPGFEEQLIGLSVAEVKKFTVTFPEGYHNPELAGKDAEFEVELVKIETPVLPEVDAEFIKAYGIDTDDVAVFREDVKANMERELKRGLKNKQKDAVLEALYTHLPVTVPNVLIDAEIKELTKPYIEQLKARKQTLQDLPFPADFFESQARRRVALSLLISEIVKQNTLTIDPEQVRAVIEDMAKSYEQPSEVINWYYADKERLQDVEQMVLEEQAIEWVINQAKITDSLFSFNEVMQKQQAAEA